MRPLGVFAPGDERGWSEVLKEQMNAVPIGLREQVAGYLEAGTIFFAWMGYTRDVISGSFTVAGGSAICSDGQYYWRADAAEYVREYGIAVPREAIEEMRRRDWAPPSFPEDGVEFRRFYNELSSTLGAGLDG